MTSELDAFYENVAVFEGAVRTWALGRRTEALREAEGLSMALSLTADTNSRNWLLPRLQSFLEIARNWWSLELMGEVDPLRAYVISQKGYEPHLQSAVDRGMNQQG